MLIWRCSSYASLDGDGGLRVSGRWHTIGHRITYCAQNASAALLEVLAHLKSKASLVPKDLKYQVIEVPKSVSVERVTEAALPADWRTKESITRAIGDAWIDSQRTAVLEVPSVLSPETHNFLLNPLHADSRKIRIVKSLAHPLDSRLITGIAQSEARA